MSRRLLPAALLTAALLTGGCSPEEYVAPPPTQGSELADPGVAGATLTALQEALGDPGAAAALGSDSQASSLLRAVAENAAALRLSDVTFGYVTETGRTSGTDGWDGLVALTWRMEGFDAASARIEIPVSFADGGRRIAAIGGEGARLPLWLTGPVEVRRVPGAIVIANEPASDVDDYARRARRAVVDAGGLLDKSTGLVVEIPADTVALHRALDVDRGTYDNVAAVTASADGSRAEGSPVRVFVNRAVYDDLDDVAAQVVMTHESVHALTGAPRAQGAPLWLLEGFADYVALRGLDLPSSRTAGQVIEQVRRDGLPETLPSDAGFNPTTQHLGTIYEAAWQVSVTLADRGGEQDLVAFYEAVLGGTRWTTALQRRFAWTEAQLTEAWRTRLAALANVSE